jgi:broad specificity phosphatase PhoE
MKTVTFHYVRHGQTVYNLEHITSGWTNSDLTELGKQQAGEARDLLAAVPLRRAYVSPLGRTRQTAAIVLAGRNVPVTYLDDLKEVHFGRFEGERVEDHPEVWQLNRTGEVDWSQYGGESPRQVTARIDRAFSAMMAAAQDGDQLLVVSHGMYFRYLIEHLLGIPMAVLKANVVHFPAPNGYIGVFSGQNGRYTLERMIQEAPGTAQRLRAQSGQTV